MNKFLSYITLFLGISITLTSCSSDDNKGSEEELVGKNTVTLTFDHKMFGQEMQFGTAYKANGNNEEINADFLKYILSNFQLINDKGKAFTYPKDSGYFVIDSETKDYKVVLKDVPAGRYEAIKFGVGVDREKFLKGQTDQQEFWDLCKKHDLTWSWITGYKFINYQGEFKNVDLTKKFSFHIGSHGTSQDNYRDTTIKTTNKIVVDVTTAANVVINVEVSKMLDSTHKIILKEKSTIMVDAVNAPKIMENAITMFSIAKVNTQKSL
ncbi:MAG: MbnP family protein [Flavobacterium sp.]